MRADARRNRELLLEAARDVFVERGPAAPLDEIARRVGVGIATLYRHFPDRRSLMHAVVLNALVATGDAAEDAQREHADAMAALSAYVHAVIDLRTSVVIPTLLDELDLDEPSIAAARTRSASAMEDLLAAAHKAGALRKGVTFGDVGLMLVRLSRPLPGSIPAETQMALAHRHADIVLAGLSASPSADAIGGPELELEQLRGFRPRRSENRTGRTGT